MGQTQSATATRYHPSAVSLSDFEDAFQPIDARAVNLDHNSPSQQLESNLSSPAVTPLLTGIRASDYAQGQQDAYGRLVQGSIHYSTSVPRHAYSQCRPNLHQGGQPRQAHRREISFLTSDGGATAKSGFLQRGTRRLSSVFSAGSGSIVTRRQELLSFLNPVPVHSEQRNTSKDGAAHAIHQMNGKRKFIGPMRSRPGAAQQPLRAGAAHVPQDTFVVLPPPSSTSWMFAHGSLPNAAQQKMADVHGYREPTLTSQPCYHTQAAASNTALVPSQGQSADNACGQKRDSERRSRIVRRPMIRSHSLPNSTSVAMQGFLPASDGQNAPEPFSQEVNAPPTATLSMITPWSVARSSITPIPEGEEDEELSERRGSVNMQGSTSVCKKGGDKVTSPRMGPCVLAAKEKHSSVTSSSGARSSGNGDSGSATGSGSGGYTGAWVDADTSDSSSYSLGGLTPSFCRGNVRNERRDSAEGGTVPSVQFSDRGHTPNPVPEPLAFALKQGLGHVYVDDDHDPMNQPALRSRTRPKSWTPGVGDLERLHQISTGTTQPRTLPIGLVRTASSASGEVYYTPEPETPSGLNIAFLDAQRNTRRNSSSLLKLGENQIERERFFGPQISSFHPRPAASSAHEAYVHPKDNTIFPTTPTSIFEHAAPNFSPESTLKAATRTPSLRHSSGSGSVAQGTRGRRKAEALSKRESVTSRPATHSRSNSMSTAHIEVETLRAGPRAHIVDVESATALFDRISVAASKRKSLGLFSRFRRGRKGRRKHTMRGGSESSVSAAAITEQKVIAKGKGKQSNNASPERRHPKQHAVRSVKRTSIVSLRAKARYSDSSLRNKLILERLSTIQGTPVVNDRASVPDTMRTETKLQPQEGAWEDVEDRTALLASPAAKSLARRSVGWDRSKSEGSDASASPPTAVVAHMSRTKSTPFSTTFGSSSEKLGQIINSYDVSATIRGFDSVPVSSTLEDQGATMDQHTYLKAREFSEWQRYELAASGFPSSGSVPFELVPPRRRSSCRKRSSLSSTSESSHSSPVAAQVSATYQSPEFLTPASMSVHTQHEVRNSSPHASGGMREILPSNLGIDDEQERFRQVSMEEDRIAGRPRRPLPVPQIWPFTGNNASGHLSSLGSDYKHRGDMLRSREASEATDASVGVISVNPSEPVDLGGALTDLDPRNSGSNAFGHIKKNSGDSATVVNTAAPARAITTTTARSVDGEISHESDPFAKTLLHQTQAADRASRSPLERSNVLHPFASPTFGTHPPDPPQGQHSFRGDVRGSRFSSNSTDYRSRITEVYLEPAVLYSRVSPTTNRKSHGRHRFKSHPAAPPGLSDLDSSGDTLPEPVPFPERAVQASLAALHALERSDDLDREWAFERLMGMASRSGGEQFAAARRRLERLQGSNDDVDPPTLQHSRPRRRTDPYRSSRLHRKASEDSSSGIDETFSRHSASRARRRAGADRRMVNASGMTTVSRLSYYTGSESEDAAQILRLLSCDRLNAGTGAFTGTTAATGASSCRFLHVPEARMRRPRMPSDWHRSLAIDAQVELPDVTEHLSNVPTVQEPAPPPLDTERAVGMTRHVPTPIEWGENIVPALRSRLNREAEQQSSSWMPAPAHDSPPVRKRLQVPQRTASRQATQPLVRGFDRESFPTPSLSGMDVLSPPHLSRRSSTHSKQKKGYGLNDIMAWQASLDVVQA